MDGCRYGKLCISWDEEKLLEQDGYGNEICSDYVPGTDVVSWKGKPQRRAREDGGKD